MLLAWPDVEWSLTKTAVVLIGVLALGSYDIVRRLRGRNMHLLFACILGTVVSLGLIQISRVVLDPVASKNAHVLALGVVLLILLWRTLFGPWEVQTKLTVLGTFLFWVALHLLMQKPPMERTVHMLAVAVALIPAGIWMMFFGKYHRERFSSVALLFFAGMLSTFPILFYDALVRRGVELQFFVVRVVPESFNATSQQFVAGQLANIRGVHPTIIATLISFLIVGVIEEVSKYWVLRKSGERIFSSIDDVMQLAIMTAVGFAFAENVSQSGYFLNFVREYLVMPDTPDVMGFVSNVVGRSVLTNMVHIVSTGVLGYFVGLAIFARPYLRDGDRKGALHPFTEMLHRGLHIPREKAFRMIAITCGMLSAVLLHALFNFSVTLPDLLPGQPRTLGDLVGESVPILRSVPVLLFPALLYVVGGFWLLTELFLQNENVKERGHLVTITEYVEE